MDYTEQFIRLNCSLMSDYKMMKLNADMKCMGLGLYLETILFLRKQQEYKHDFNELDLLADQWGATVENLQHLTIACASALTDSLYSREVPFSEHPG